MIRIALWYIVISSFQFYSRRFKLISRKLNHVRSRTQKSVDFMLINNWEKIGSE